MRFYEYEAREIVRREDIPGTEYGFTRDPSDAAEIAARIGGPRVRNAPRPRPGGGGAGGVVVVKSRVWGGGGMRAGGIRFADTPADAEREAREVLELEIGGHKPRG